ncbi:MAG: alanine racemase C-terminal domain-containing protein, partial [Mariprofundaceae bacterium]
LPGSLLNSAGIAAMPGHRWDVVRPGIALYGVEPVASLRLGLKPVMRFSSRIMAMPELTPGDSVSYGATYTATEDRRIAVVAAGYADGLPRSLSNTGAAVWQGQRLAIIGRVCMDYCMVDMGGHAPRIGDDIEFWGEALLASEAAKQAGTITYELFTGLSPRVVRRAVEHFS